MKRFRKRAAVVVLLLVAALAAPCFAQEDAAGELRDAMREYFETRLRSELSLSDDQVEHILPRVQQLEDSKRAAQHERMESVRRLRRGMEQGATDSELQESLDLLDRTENEQWQRERSLLQEIDEVLSTRQRVQLRFFIQRFRRQMQAKIRELRGDPGAEERPNRRPPREPRR